MFVVREMIRSYRVELEDMVVEMKVLFERFSSRWELIEDNKYWVRKCIDKFVIWGVLR